MDELTFIKEYMRLMECDEQAARGVFIYFDSAMAGPAAGAEQPAGVEPPAPSTATPTPPAPV
jgi:hypothetical protein